MRDFLSLHILHSAGNAATAAVLLAVLPSLAVAQPVLSPRPALILAGSAETASQWMTDQGDVATDGAGVWLVLWPDSTGYIRASRSVDDGQSWSLGAAVGPQWSHGWARLATDGAGNWLAAWRGQGGLFVSKSTDLGATWASPAKVAEYHDAAYPAAYLAAPQLVFGGGVWVFMWGDRWQDTCLFTSRSVDNGDTWTEPAALSSSACYQYPPTSQFRVATDLAGNWLTVVLKRWGSSDRILAFRSVDQAQSWSAPTDLFTDQHPSRVEELGLAAGPGGEWMLAFGGLYDSTSDDPFNPDVHVMRSHDEGLTWDAPALVDATSLQSRKQITDARRPFVLYEADSQRWWVMWVKQGLPFDKGDSDLAYVTSEDGGDSWSRVIALNASSSGDGLMDSAVSYVLASGTLIVPHWRYQYLGRYGGDVPPPMRFDTDVGLAITRSRVGCPAEPATSCLPSNGSSRLQIRNLRGTNDSLRWNWTAANGFAQAIGDPGVDGNLRFCLYERTDVAVRLVFDREIVAGGTCRGQPCWATTAASATMKYRDPRAARSPIKLLSLGPDSGAPTRFDLRAGGSALGPPLLPVPTGGSIVAQLVDNQDSVCWGASMTRLVQDDANTLVALE